MPDENIGARDLLAFALTIDAGETPLWAEETIREELGPIVASLFYAPQTIRGQLAMDTDGGS